MEEKLLKPIYLSDRIITTELEAYVMGILNVSPDSFWMGGKNTNSSIEKALAMIEAGADIIDIGGEATNPGKDYVDEETELQRIIPVIEGIRRHSVCPISVDTRKKNVLEAAIDAGADILNDISAMEDDGQMVHYVATKKIPVILMHKKGNPKDMQISPFYNDVVEEVSEYLKGRCEFALENGIESNKIILDAGIGFGKNLEHNLKLIKASEKISGVMGEKKHMVMALSRKKCLEDITGRKSEDRLIATVAANLFALKYGADILRVHDVAECVDMLKIYREFA